MNSRLTVISLVALAAVAVVSVAAAQSPTASPSPNATTTPVPQPTPWPPPPNLGVKGGCIITHADGSFIPPAERQCSVMVVWVHLQGFTGDYEIELQIQPWDPPPLPYVRVATVPASAVVNGEGRYDDAFAFADAMGTVRCYRVRMVINGETGPYTNPVCQSFAGVVDGPGAPPRPPDTGSGTASSLGDRSFITLALAGALTIAGGGLLVVARRRA
ncbi:MAG: LPXTG cell wall anchor domain-containing protein [Thermoflexaceae bacterium]|nr:LPXTG cell wall anchor domain-containing protein [Thermoflexaceae bacterium]